MNKTSDAYSQALSMSRAATARDCLVAQGVSANLVRAFRVGKTHPMVRCAGTLHRAELAACLPPNRRAELEVLGQR